MSPTASVVPEPAPGEIDRMILPGSRIRFQAHYLSQLPLAHSRNRFSLQ